MMDDTSKSGLSIFISYWCATDDVLVQLQRFLSREQFFFDGAEDSSDFESNRQMLLEVAVNRCSALIILASPSVFMKYSRNPLDNPHVLDFTIRARPALRQIGQDEQFPVIRDCIGRKLALDSEANLIGHRYAFLPNPRRRPFMSDQIRPILPTSDDSILDAPSVSALRCPIAFETASDSTIDAIVDRLAGLTADAALEGLGFEGGFSDGTSAEEDAFDALPGSIGQFRDDTPKVLNLTEPPLHSLLVRGLSDVPPVVQKNSGSEAVFYFAGHARSADQAFGSQLRTVLRRRLRSDVYDSWFASVDVGELCEARIQILFPTRFLAGWVQAHYSPELWNACREAFGRPLDLSIGTKPVSASQATPNGLRGNVIPPSASPAPAWSVGRGSAPTVAPAVPRSLLGFLEVAVADDFEPAREALVIEGHGSIKWFDASKGYGFIVPDNGGRDVLLHVTCLRACGFQTVHEGARIHFQAVARPAGLQAFRVLSMDDSTAIHPGQLSQRTHVIVEPASDWVRAMVKWFNRVRGFGFLTTGEGTTDIFVHMETMRRFGLTELRPGQIVDLRWGHGSKGIMAAELRPPAPPGDPPDRVH